MDFDICMYCQGSGEVQVIGLNDQVELMTCWHCRFKSSRLFQTEEMAKANKAKIEMAVRIIEGFKPKTKRSAS